MSNQELLGRIVEIAVANDFMDEGVLYWRCDEDGVVRCDIDGEYRTCSQRNVTIDEDVYLCLCRAVKQLSRMECTNLAPLLVLCYIHKEMPEREHLRNAGLDLLKLFTDAAYGIL